MAELVGDRLAAFVADNSSIPWRPGTVDCCMFLASWAMWIGHPDPAGHLRGTYDDDDGFRRIIAAAGGVVPVVESCISSIGGVRIAAPSLGAVAVIGARTNTEHQFGAIFDGQRWLVRFTNRVGHMAACPLAIWKI
ncbi:DUF6950 family protein [Rhizobium laguerreae]|uniref:DUF6950 family protein n=1 Tax=Rhizobium laguerreae TaxID=1076926 RepID=UPI0035E4325F